MSADNYPWPQQSPAHWENLHYRLRRVTTLSSSSGRRVSAIGLVVMFAFRLHRSYFHSRPYCVDPTSRSFGWCSRRKVVPSSTTIAASSLFVIANTGSENDAAFSRTPFCFYYLQAPDKAPGYTLFRDVSTLFTDSDNLFIDPSRKWGCNCRWYIYTECDGSTISNSGHAFIIGLSWDKSIRHFCCRNSAGGCQRYTYKREWIYNLTVLLN